MVRIENDAIVAMSSSDFAARMLYFMLECIEWGPYTLNRNVICFVSSGRPTTFNITLAVSHQVSTGTSQHACLSPFDSRLFFRREEGAEVWLFMGKHHGPLHVVMHDVQIGAEFGEVGERLSLTFQARI